MKGQIAKVIFVSSLIGLLLSSTVIIFGGANPAEATEQGEVSSSSELTAASGSNRFVVWSDETFGSRDILFRRSTDNGATWKSTVNLSSNPGTSDEPLIAVSGSNVYVIWEQGSAQAQGSSVTFRKSMDNGATWGPKIKITGDLGSCCSSMHLAASENNVYVVLSNGGPGEIYLKRSNDTGASWLPAVNLSSNPGDSSDPSITTSGANVYVIWTQGSSTGSSYDIFFRRSTDNGSTWKSRINLSNDAEFSMHPRIVASGSNLHSVWDNGHYRRSTDNGVTWKSVQTLDCASDEPKIAVSGNKVYVASISISRELLLCRSIDGGATWKDVKTVFSSGNCYAASNFFDLAASVSNVFATCNPGEFTPLIFSRSTDSGSTWSSAKEVFPTGMSFGHVLAVTGSSVFIVGTELTDTSNDDFGVLQEVFLARSTDSGATWKTPKNLSNTPEQSSMAQIGI